jgi:hypothetical protein
MFGTDGAALPKLIAQSRDEVGGAYILYLIALTAAKAGP